MTFGIDAPADQVPQDRSPLAAAQRVNAAEQAVADAIRGAVDMRDDADLRLWDIRLAAALNSMDIARAHGEHQYWTAEHSRQIRAMMAIADEVVTGDANAIVPSGFGPPVRTALAEALIKAHARAAGTQSGEAAGAEGGT